MRIDVHSETWQAVEIWAKGEISDLTEMLITENDEIVRGQIQALKRLLSLAE